MPIVIDSELTHADWAALQQALTGRVRARIGQARLLGAVLAPLVAAALFIPDDPQ